MLMSKSKNVNVKALTEILYQIIKEEDVTTKRIASSQDHIIVKITSVVDPRR